MAFAALLLGPWPLIALACSADPKPAPVVVLDTPKSEPTTTPPDEPPSEQAERAPVPEPSESPGDGGVYEFSFSASVATGDGGLDISFRSSSDGGMSFSATLGADGGLVTFGPAADAGAPAPSTSSPRAKPDAGSRPR